MRRGIPKCVAWQLTTPSGDKYVLLAPTRRLALLNLRCFGLYQGIESIGRTPKYDTDLSFGLYRRLGGDLYLVSVA